MNRTHDLIFFYYFGAISNLLLRKKVLLSSSELLGTKKVTPGDVCYMSVHNKVLSMLQISSLLNFIVPAMNYLSNASA